MTLGEQYAQALDNLLNVLRMVKASGQMVDGVPSESLFNFAKSEINALFQGTKTKGECSGCSHCCIAPQAIVPLQGIDGGVIRPLQYGLKQRRQPCWWLRQENGAFKCCLHATNEKPFTCLGYLCTSRQDLENLISNAEKGSSETKQNKEATK